MLHATCPAVLFVPPATLPSAHGSVALKTPVTLPRHLREKSDIAVHYSPRSGKPFTAVDNLQVSAPKPLGQVLVANVSAHRLTPRGEALIHDATIVHST